MESLEWFRTAEAARRLGIHPQTLRAWEKGGVIDIAPRRRGQRVYTPEDLMRIRDSVISSGSQVRERQGGKS